MPQIQETTTLSYLGETVVCQSAEVGFDDDLPYRARAVSVCCGSARVSSGPQLDASIDVEREVRAATMRNGEVWL